MNSKWVFFFINCSNCHGWFSCVNGRGEFIFSNL